MHISFFPTPPTLVPTGGSLKTSKSQTTHFSSHFLQLFIQYVTHFTRKYTQKYHSFTLLISQIRIQGLYHPNHRISFEALLVFSRFLNALDLLYSILVLAAGITDTFVFDDDDDELMISLILINTYLLRILYSTTRYPCG